jgi:16S rRNA (cytosine967-C5)-methyltransferase
MNFIVQHIQSIIEQYNGSLPLAIFIKQYCKAFPKLGSRDRKAIAEGVYIYYRCQRLLPPNLEILRVIQQGYAYCNSENIWLKKMLNCEAVTPSRAGELNNYRPITTVLSSGISMDEWCKHMLQQPRTFIRVQQDWVPQVVSILEKESKPFEVFDFNPSAFPSTIALAPSIALEQWLPLHYYAIQDWASQQSMHTVCAYLKKAPRSVWDVCAGAGGKSLFLKSIYESTALYVSDIRASILHNLKDRFSLYKLGKVHQAIIDATQLESIAAAWGQRQFEAVICDVPCSGSGTWSRTPEQFHFYDNDLSKYEALQYTIAFNAQQSVQAGGYFFYITCSVFEQENEKVVQRLLDNTQLTLVHQSLINGLALKADCMYIAVFKAATK